MDYSHLFTGFTRVKIIAINPSKEEVEKITDGIVDEEINYKKGNKFHLHIYMKNARNMLFMHNIVLSAKEETFKTGFSEYVNSSGDSMRSKSEDYLWSSFKNHEKILSWGNAAGKTSKLYFPGARPTEVEIVKPKEYRIAKEGEADLNNFIGICSNDSEINTLCNVDKILISGDVSEIWDKIGKDKDYHCTSFIYVTPTMIQAVWKRFLNVNFIEEVGHDMIGLRKYAKIFEKFKSGIESEYGGLTGHYNFGRLTPFKSDFIKQSSVKADDDDTY